MKQREAFTVIELIFVIIVIGILSAIAIPKFAATRDDAIITRAINTIASARSALAMERQKHILKGDFVDINMSTIGDNFSNILEYDVKSCNTAQCGGWHTDAASNQFIFRGPTGDVTLTLNHNKLDCSPTSRCENEYDTH